MDDGDEEEGDQEAGQPEGAEEPGTAALIEGDFDDEDDEDFDEGAHFSSNSSHSPGRYTPRARLH